MFWFCWLEAFGTSRAIKRRTQASSCTAEIMTLIIMQCLENTIETSESSELVCIVVLVLPTCMCTHTHTKRAELGRCHEHTYNVPADSAAPLQDPLSHTECASLHPRPLEWRRSGQGRLAHVSWSDLRDLSSQSDIEHNMHVAYSSHAECTGITAMARCSPLLNAADFSFHLRSTRRNFSPHSEIAAAALGCANI